MALYLNMATIDLVYYIGVFIAVVMVVFMPMIAWQTEKQHKQAWQAYNDAMAQFKPHRFNRIKRLLNSQRLARKKWQMTHSNRRINQF